MRTNIVIDDDLLHEAMARSHARTKREIVDLALREFVQRRKRQDLMDLFGKGGLREDYDHKALRHGEPATERE